MTHLERLRHRLASWVDELDRGGPWAEQAGPIITGLQDEIWALEKAAINAADKATAEALLRAMRASAAVQDREAWPTKERPKR